MTYATKRTLYACLAFALVVATGSCRRDTTSSSSEENQTAADKQTAAAAIVQADSLYAQREDLLKVRQGIVALRQSRTMDPGNYDAAWRLAKFDYYLGAHTTDSNEKDKAFREGVEAGKAAVKLRGDKADGHFWLGANYGGIAQASALGGLTSLDNVRTEMQTVLKVDESYQSGSAYMVLGQVDLEAPEALGGSEKRAVEELEKGLRFGDKNSLLRLELAKAYIAVKRLDDGRKQLNTIITMTPDPSYMVEHKEAVEEAKKILSNNLKVD